MKKFDLNIKDKTGADALEGSIIAVITTKRKGYREDGIVFKKKIVYGRFNQGGNVCHDFNGFIAVDMDKPDSIFDGTPHYYDGISVRYLLESQGGEIIGNIHDNPELAQS